MADGRMRIGIIGGGLAGATIANALVQLPYIGVHVFESAPEFSERGAAVGLSTNAQRALDEILPSSKQLLEKAGAVPMNSTRIVLVSRRPTLSVQ
jgi:salicylate hydroxylase